VAAYFGGRPVDVRNSWAGSRHYLVLVEREARRGYVIFDVTGLFPSPAGQAARGSPTAGLGWAILAFAGLLGFIWLSRPETARR
jgi:hypothetical protein